MDTTSDVDFWLSWSVQECQITVPRWWHVWTCAVVVETTQGSRGLYGTLGSRDERPRSLPLISEGETFLHSSPFTNLWVIAIPGEVEAGEIHVGRRRVHVKVHIRRSGGGSAAAVQVVLPGGRECKRERERSCFSFFPPHPQVMTCLNKREEIRENVCCFVFVIKHLRPGRILFGLEQDFRSQQRETFYFGLKMFRVFNV